MKNSTIWRSNYFFGNEVSEYGKEHHRIDYATLAKSFQHILNNDIIGSTGWDFWEQENGFVDNSEEIEELTESIEALEDRRADLEDILYRYDNGEDYGIPRSQIPATSAELEKIEAQIEELENERDDYETEQDEQPEIFQYFIISEQGADILKDYTDEIVFYNSHLDMYVWGVTHRGTSWDYVLTDIKIELDDSKTA